MLRVTGTGAGEAFADERGGHRWQRVPPNEKRGRVHTSTVTVAVLPEPAREEIILNDRDLEWHFTKASSSGGQHAQKNETGATVTHIPTGLTATCKSSRSQHANKQSARVLLAARILEKRTAEQDRTRDTGRRKQVGSGMRGDKRRTIALQRGTVKDHVTGKTWSTTQYLKGEW